MSIFAQIRPRRPVSRVGDPGHGARDEDCDTCGPRMNLPQRRQGVAQDMIDAVKYRKPVTQLGENGSGYYSLGRDSIANTKWVRIPRSRRETIWKSGGRQSCFPDR